MRPSDEEIRELCKSHTQKELGSIWGVTDRTVMTWTTTLGCSPAYYCLLCRTAKPRDECVHERRCKSCDEAVSNGTFDLPKYCGGCKADRPGSMFYIQRQGENKTLSLSSECRECRSKKWKAARNEEDEEYTWAAHARKVFFPATFGRLFPYGLQPTLEMVSEEIF